MIIIIIIIIIKLPLANYYKIKDNNCVVYKHPYRKSPEELLAIKNEIQRMLKMKIIQPSKSEWGAPCNLVRKPA